MIAAIWSSQPDSVSETLAVFIGCASAAILGIGGALISYFSPQGTLKTWILRVYYFIATAGVLLLLAGIITLACGSPYSRWFPPTFIGTLFVVVTSFMIPEIRRGHRKTSNSKPSDSQEA
jgi:hypothetical protein